MICELTCPACGEETDHTVLKESGDLLVQCSVCGQIYHIPKPKEPEVINVKTIVSMEDISKKGTVELIDEEFCAVDDLLVAECDDDALGVEVAAIETKNGKRRYKVKASDIAVLWTRVVEKVVVKFSVNDGRKTIPLYEESEGEDDYIIGEIYNVQGVRFRVNHIKLRKGSMMRKEGWKAYARKIKRIYGSRI